MNLSALIAGAIRQLPDVRTPETSHVLAKGFLLSHSLMTFKEIACAPYE